MRTDYRTCLIGVKLNWITFLLYFVDSTTSNSSSIFSTENHRKMPEVVEEYQNQIQKGQYTNSVSEIEEEEELFEVKCETLGCIKEEFDQESSLFSFEIQKDEDCVYVAVGKSESSMDALTWTLNYNQAHRLPPSAASSSTFVVYLIHVFPEVHYIPTPLGKLPKSSASPEQVENYMAQERGKRRDFLHKFLNMASSFKVKIETILIESDMAAKAIFLNIQSAVKVETILIESDMAAKAILDLIPILNIRKLVIGTTKSNIRKSKSRRGNGVADQIIENAPDWCDVKIICNGKEVIENINGLPSPGGDSNHSDDQHLDSTQDGGQQKDSFSFLCFKQNCLR